MYTQFEKVSIVRSRPVKTPFIKNKISVIAEQKYPQLKLSQPRRLLKNLSSCGFHNIQSGKTFEVGQCAAIRCSHSVTCCPSLAKHGRSDLALGDAGSTPATTVRILLLWRRIAGVFHGARVRVSITKRRKKPDAEKRRGASSSFGTAPRLC